MKNLLNRMRAERQNGPKKSSNWKSRKQLSPFLVFTVYFLLLSGFSLVSQPFIFAQTNMPCKFEPRTLQFHGSPKKQARCLLRPVLPRGVLGPELKELPAPLENLVGEKTKIKKEKLKQYLTAQKIAESEIGGPIGAPLATAKQPNGRQVQSLYFIIHDTSTPNYRLEAFPHDINDQSWRLNNLEMWLKNPVAHIFINRLGASITTTPLAEPVRKGWGTKFARDFLKTDAKGLQIHIELVQPRRSDKSWFEGNDAIAPEPGFTDAQYERLALLYIVASARRGRWLIPAFHSAIDAGIKDAHDDPQNFELQKFAGKIDKLNKILRN